MTTGCQPCQIGEDCVDEAADDDALCLLSNCDDTDPTIGGGAGTADDPYRICAVAHLDYLDTQSSASFLLMDSLDLEGTNFDGLATFSGTLDGGGHTIKGLTLDNSGEDQIGLFVELTADATVANLSLTDLFIRADSRVGALAATNHGTIERVIATGATNSGVDITNSADIIGEGDRVGGLVGINQGTIHQSGTDLLIVSENDDRVGGLVGRNNGTITESFARGDINDGDTAIGGLAGRNNGTIEDSYATGNITGEKLVGGFVGNNHQGTILRSYAFGEATGDEDIGGFVGAITGGAPNSTVDHCYWNDDLNGDDSSSETTGLSAAGFGDSNNFHSDWDFNDPGLWEIGADNRPTLQWESQP